MSFIVIPPKDFDIKLTQPQVAVMAAMQTALPAARRGLFALDTIGGVLAFDDGKAVMGVLRAAGVLLHPWPTVAALKRKVAKAADLSSHWNRKRKGR